MTRTVDDPEPSAAERNIHRKAGRDGRMSGDLIDEATLWAFLAQEWDRLHHDQRFGVDAKPVSSWPTVGIALGVIGVFVGAIGGWPLVTVASVGIALLALFVTEPG